MSTERSARPRRRKRFPAPLEALEARALLNGSVDVDTARFTDGGVPTVSIGAGTLGADGTYPVSGNLYFDGSVSSAEARVEVYVKARRGKPVLLGQGTHWTATSWYLFMDNPLPDGLYAIQARAVDVTTGVAGEFVQLPGKLNIDTAGPRVVGVQMHPRQGRIVVLFRELGGYRNVGSGFETASLTYPRAYTLAPASAPSTEGAYDPRWEVTAIETSPSTRRGVQRVVVTINGGTEIPAGRYRFSIRSPGPDYPATTPFIHIPAYVWGVNDAAGNLLDGGATSTITPPDSNDFATVFEVRQGRASRPGPAGPSGPGPLRPIAPTRPVAAHDGWAGGRE